jgi:hypothetical protein
MEGDFIWLRVLQARANMTATFSDMTRFARHVSLYPNPHSFPHPSGWAEERSRKRVRTSDCLSAASSSSAPLSASTAGCPQRSGGTQTIGSPFSLLTFFLATQKESELPPGNPRLVGKLQRFKKKSSEQTWIPDHVRDEKPQKNICYEFNSCLRPLHKGGDPKSLIKMRFQPPQAPSDYCTWHSCRSSATASLSA